jgi:hypothetical protein
MDADRQGLGQGCNVERNVAGETMEGIARNGNELSESAIDRGAY